MKTTQQLLCVFLVLFSMDVMAAEGTKRSKSLNFEDEMVEGINRKNLDSVNQISERDQRNLQHLYRKRATFWDRDQELMNEMRLRQ